MKKIDVGQAIQILANVGVITSLVFVGMQLQQEVAATRSTTVQQQRQAWILLNVETATSPELAEALLAARTKDWSEIDDRDQIPSEATIDRCSTSGQMLTTSTETGLWMKNNGRVTIER